MSRHQSRLAAMAAVAVALSSGPVAAARLLTAPADYTGPTLSTGGLGEPFYLYTAGPQALPGGITFTSSNVAAVIGVGGYGFGNNGITVSTPIIGTNSEVHWVDLTFDTPVAMFGGGFNYGRTQGDEDIDDSFFGLTPTISAFDEDDNLIAAYDLFVEAPIVTPGEIDAFLFRAIDGEGALIKRFRLQGSFIAMAATGRDTLPPDPPVIPEPATWAMMIAGFGLVGFAARRRRTLAAA